MKKAVRKITLLFTVILSIIVFANAQELKLEILNGHSGGGILAVAVSDDGKFALTGSTDWTALLWDLETGKQLRRFVGHEDAVSAVHFSKDGRYVLTASHDKTAILWETATGKKLRTFVENRNGKFIGHTDKILSAKISPDGRFVATAGEDKTARIWDLQKGIQLFELKHEGRVNSIAFSPDSKFLLTGGEDKIARLFSTEMGKLEKQFVGHTKEIISVDYSLDGEHALTGSLDNSVRLLDVTTSNEVFKLYNFRVKTATFTKNGEQILILDGRNTYLWDIHSSKIVWEKEDTYAEVGIFSKHAKKLLIVQKEPNNKSVKIFDIARSPDKEILTLSGLSSIVSKVSITRKLDSFATASIGKYQFSVEIGSGFRSTKKLAKTINTGTTYSKTLGVWNVKAGQHFLWKNVEGANLEQSSSRRRTIGKNENDYKLVSYKKNSQLKQKIGPGFFLKGEFDESIEFSSNKDLIAIARTNSVEIWNYIDNKIVLNIDITPNWGNLSSLNSGAKFSPKSDYLLTYLGNIAQLWSVKTGKEIRQFVGHKHKINTADYSPNGKTVVTASSDKTIRLWDTSTGEVKQIIKDSSSSIWSVAFSPDGRTIAVASGTSTPDGDNRVTLFDVETGDEIRRFVGEVKRGVWKAKIAGLKSVVFSPDGQYLLGGDFDGKSYLWEVSTGKLVRQFIGHTAEVNSVKFAKDAKGKLLVISGSSDSTTRIWDFETGEEICALVTFRDGNWAVVQTKTGRYDASNGGKIEGIQWVYGNETIELDQLSAVYYTPNLLPRLLGYNKEELYDVPFLSEIKLYPEIIEQNFDENSGNLTVKLKSRGGGIGQTQVFVKGTVTDKLGNVTVVEKLVVADARDVDLRKNPNIADGQMRTISVKLPSESFVKGSKNQIRVVTSNYLKEIGKGNIQSRGVETFYQDKRKKELELPTLYAVIGGVSDYTGSDLDLRFAAKDAEDISNALALGAKRLFGVEKVDIKTFSTARTKPEEQPTKENFKRAVAEIAKKAKPEDIIVIYLAGHGVTLGTGTDTYFYLTKEARSAKKSDLASNFQTVAISNTELVDWLTPDKDDPNDIYIKARKQVIILDTCSAGNFAREDWKKDRNGLTGDQIRAMEFLKDKTGTFVMMGSAANAVSYEANNYNQGLLTYALLEGMKGLALQKATENVDVRLLFDYAEKRVPELAKSMSLEQRPVIKQPTGNNFVIGQMTKAEKQKISLPQPKPIVLRPRLGVMPRNKDPLDLTANLRKGLDAESSYEVVRQRGDKEPILVYLDDENFPDAIEITGTYEVKGEMVNVKIYLSKGEKDIGEPIEITASKNEINKKLLDVIRTELSKLK